jgi:GMP synthase-like glutamine amidotransferase
MKISIFDKEDWRKYLPQKLKVITNNGHFELEQTDLTINGDKMQIIWYQNTVDGPNDANKDGEPDTIQFDVSMVKTNDGTEANPDNLKLNIDVTYGDSMASQFTISKPGEITVAHYTGFGSKYDKESEFGFEDDTIKELVEFFNRFGFQLDSKDFTFIDKHKDSYIYTESIKLTPSFNDNLVLVINNSKPQENRFLNNVLNYLKGRGIEHIIASSKEELQKNINDKVIGAISTGSDYRLSNPQSEDEYATSAQALKSLQCPILGVCYGMQHMGKENGANLATLDKTYDGSTILNEYDKEHPLFSGVDLSNTQVRFDFNDYLEDCPQGFKTIAKLDDKIAGIANDEKKHYGLLFHPEDIENTHPILDNFIKMCQSGKSNNDKQVIDQSKNDMKYIQTFESFRIKRKK